MNCRSAESLYSALIEDELSQKERRELESHLLGCRRCSSAVRELRATIALTQSLPAVETSARFEDDVLTRIRSGEALRPSMLEWLSGLLPPLRLRPVLAAGAGACALALAFAMFHSGSTPTGPAKDQTIANVAPPRTTSPTAPAPAAVTPSQELAAAPVHRTETPGRLKRSDVQVIQSPLALEGVPLPGDSSRAAGRPLSPQYQDEYILDQFYLERAPTSGDPSMVPASGNPNDGDVYIEF
jgi:anti-sigma factor RsiW